MTITYKDAGVDKEAGYKEVQLIKNIIKKTHNTNVLSDIGGFSGLFQLDTKSYKEPVLVSGTDGVGTKLKIAFIMDEHNTIGEDCVAMCVNDIICQGAKPLFFLDYIATGKLIPEKMAEIVEGIANGCVKGEAALIGGETAEMPGFYEYEEYDMAGFTVGIVDRSKIITGEKIKPGHVIIGLSSSGVHSNGFSLVRKIFLENSKFSLDEKIQGLEKNLGETLLEPTRIYVKPVLEVLKEIDVKGITHITGGGFYENVPRVLPEDVDANINLGSWNMPEIFNIIQREGNIATDEMYKTFNMGIGIMLIVDEKDVEKAQKILEKMGEKSFVIGNITEGKKQVVLCQK